MKLFYQCARPLWQKIRLARYQKIIRQANALESSFTVLTDTELQQQVSETKLQAQATADLSRMLPATLALGREISFRTLKMRHYDVQLIGTLALYDGCIAEMDTGEGKTLLAPLAAFLHQVSQVDRCTHIVTANEYLAQRDAHWMTPFFKGLDLSVGLVLPGQAPTERVKAYQKDIVYATAREVVFDSLREPLRRQQTSTVDAILRPQKEFNLEPNYDFAIVDEVDSVLIDQARSPLSIGSSANTSAQIDIYRKADQVAARLDRGIHYRILQDDRSIELKDEGKAESRQGVGTILRTLPSGHRWERYITCALASRFIYKIDQHYIVKDQQVVLIDESTGRLMPGRQLPDGLHQALEVHAGLDPSPELHGAKATTFQTFFRKYNKLSGMTGSASTSAKELHNVYELPIVPIPANRPRRRAIHPDRVYRSKESKIQAVLNYIKEIHGAGRPILIGTGSVLASEQLSNLLTAHHLDHEVLNAKNHAREADIIAQAGQSDCITIITNMAGRGVDILLGDGVAQKGGMYMIGTDRSAFRRLDDQLTGRVGRQGDPGECQFFLSLQDDLLVNADRKKKFRLRSQTRSQRNEVIADSTAEKLFVKMQKHNNKLGQKQRSNLYQSEKQREKLKEQGLWEDWMDAR